MSTLGLYIQVPFCASKCSFCNFSSRVERPAVFDAYLRGLHEELCGWDDHFAGRGIPREILSFSLDSIYVGGGTPSLLGGARLQTLLRSVQGRLTRTDDVEFTLEVTPGSADPDLLRALRQIGVNRLSIGVQTFADRELKAVGRLHSAVASSELVATARREGYGNISLDLIAGLPYQTEASFQASLEATARLRPEHVSLYLFEVDEKSRLGREVVHGGKRYHAAAVPGDDFMAEAYERGCNFLAREGYRQYEISNFALPGFESRHNQKYWRLAPYLGLGAGAHSFDGERRWANHADVNAYLNKVNSGESPIDDFRPLTAEAQVEEFFFLGLRQGEGVDLRVAKERWGPECLRAWKDKLDALAQEGWLVIEQDRVRLTCSAYLVSNEIFQEFVGVA